MAIEYDPEHIPSMITDSVSTLISDSGITRYKIVSDVWEVYDKAREPYWFFPKGFYLERFDNIYNVEASVISDTAWNFTNKKLWRLKGNVDMKNMQGDRFKSDELFWDQRSRKIYSDKYIEIERANGQYLQGFGFESNQEMTAYQIRRPHDGRIPINDNEFEPDAPDSLATPTSVKEPDNP